MNKRIILVLILFYNLTITSIFASDDIVVNNVRIIWSDDNLRGNSTLQAINYNLRKVVVTVSVRLSNEQIVTFAFPLGASEETNNRGRWTSHRNVRIIEVVSIIVEEF